MTTYREGQRVRIKWSIAWPELAGQEGRVVRAAIIGVGPHEGLWGWRVAPDSWGSDRDPRGTNFFCPISDQIEPLTPPHTACDSAWREKFDAQFLRVSA